MKRQISPTLPSGGTNEYLYPVMSEQLDIHLAILPPFGPEGPPLGLACIAAALRSAGYSVRAEDYNVRLFRKFEDQLAFLWQAEHKAAWVWASRLQETIAMLGDAFDALADELVESGAPILGFSVHSDNRAATVELISRIRERRPPVKIVAGGMGVFSADARNVFPNGLVDLFVVGEGEHTVVEAVRALLAGQNPANVPGVALPGRPLLERPVEKNQDLFAWPTFEDFDLRQYTTRNLPLIMSRGCTNACTMCNDRVLMGKFRRRTAKYVFTEIQHHVEKLDVHDFMIQDLQITQNLDEVLKMCRMIIDQGLEIHWNVNATVSEKFNPEVLETMHQAGCHTITLGVESGSDHVLRLMNKGLDGESAANTMRAIKAAQITCWINLVVGFPGENDEDRKETLAWIEKNAGLIDEVAVLNSCNVVDNSIIARHPEKYGILPPVASEWHEVSWTVAWRGQDANSPELRYQWLKEVKDLLDRLEIPVRQTNLGFIDEVSHRAGEQNDLLLVVCPPFEVRQPPWEPASIAAFLANEGLKIFALDLNIQSFLQAAEENKFLFQRQWHDSWADPACFADYLKRLDLSPEIMAEQILSVKAGHLYFHLARGNLLMTKAVVEHVRRLDPNRAIIIGGEPTRREDERNLFPPALCDFAVIGEPEEALLDLLRRHRPNGDLHYLRGVRWIDEGGVPHWLPREPIRDLDQLGHPTFREFVPVRYRSVTLPIRLSRGCPLRCAFCAEQPAAGPFRTRSAESVFAEMRHHQTKWQTLGFEFTDLIINGDLIVLEKLCDLIIESGQKYKWSGQAAPRADMPPELFKKLARAGCVLLRFGVESFADPVLALMNKTYSGADAVANLRAAHDAGIETHINLIAGFPGETEADFLTTARVLRDAREVIASVDEIAACDVLSGSILKRDCRHFEILLPQGDPSHTWSYHGYNNYSWRETRKIELAVWISGLDIKFNYNFFAPPQHPLRQLESNIRRRIEQKLLPEAAAVLVTLPPWGYENPPVGLAYLSTYLRAHGLRTEVRDYNIRFYHQTHRIYHMLWHVENKNYWSNEQTFEVVKYSLRGLIDQAVEELVNLKPKLLGFSVVDPKERITIEVIKKFRRLDQQARIILGGPACFTPEYRQIFIDQAGDLIDGFCIGEGEETLLETARRVMDGRDLQGIPGLMVLDENRECRFTPRAPIAVLDSIPPPTYNEFDHGLYPGDSLILEWSRGCIGNCTYCKGKQISGDYRTRSAKHIFEELRRHEERHGYRNFTISDNLINGSPRVLDELCDLIRASGLEIRWNGEGIPLPGMARQLLDKMARAGCYELQWGLECGSDNVLRRMAKNRLFTTEQAQQVIRDSHEAGIKTCLFIIVGFPGETAGEFQQTVEFIRRNVRWIDQIKSINSMHVITGTAIHRHPESFGIVLPERDYHYLWRSADGTNTPAERNRRIRVLLDLCRDLRIEVRETNLTEGKHEDLAAAIGDQRLSMEERMKRLIDEINDLRSFETQTVEAADRAPISIGEYPSYSSETAGSGAPVELPPAPSTKENVEFIAENLALAGILDRQRVFAGPELLEIDLTNFCNLDCIGCWNHSPLMGEKRMRGEEKQRRLPLEMLLKLIDDAAMLGAKQVQLSGAGEPLCHPDALRVIERIKERRLECTLITNGTLLTDKTVRRLIELGLDHLTVSVWAGTLEIYQTTHPNQKAKTLNQIKKSLQYLYELKTELRRYKPQVKVYNVVSHLNAGDMQAMITFAVEALAEHVEFTPIDVVPGYTDELALTDADRQSIIRQLEALPRREDYLELDPTRGARSPEANAEGLEFARFVNQSVLPKGFRYELDDITKFDVLCPRKEWRLDVQEDNQVENALLFYYPTHECLNCPDYPRCAIDKERYLVKVKFTSFLGFGAFRRRISTPAQGRAYDADKVDTVPCCIGWIYARVKTDGAVIPCCKGDRMPLGNLYKQDFLSIWTSPEYMDFRQKALELSKKDPFFDPIDCMAACDNLGHNLAVAERLAKLAPELRQKLSEPEKEGFGEL